MISATGSEVRSGRDVAGETSCPTEESSMHGENQHHSFTLCKKLTDRPGYFFSHFFQFGDPWRKPGLSPKGFAIAVFSWNLRAKGKIIRLNKFLHFTIL